MMSNTLEGHKLGISHSVCERSASFATFCSCDICYQATPKYKTGGMSKIAAKLHGKQSGARLRCMLRGYFREGTNRQYDVEDYALSVVQQASSAVQ